MRAWPPCTSTGAGPLPRVNLVGLAGRALGAVPPPAQVLAGIVSVQVGAALAKQLFGAVGSAGTVALRLFFAAAVLLVVWRPSLRTGLGRRGVGGGRRATAWCSAR